MATFVGNTSSNHYKIVLAVDVDAKSTTASQLVKLQLWLAKTDSGTKRYRHTWNITYAVDNDPKKTRTESYTLPDDNAEPGVESRGYLNMVKGTTTPDLAGFYEWGPAYYVSVNNDGQSHTFAVSCSCLGTIPRTGSVSGTVVMPSQKITPGVPTVNPYAFDESTRKITYQWNASANAAYYHVTRTAYKEDGSVCTGYNGWLGDVAIKDTTLSRSEILPDDCSYVNYTVYAISSTGHTNNTAVQTANVGIAFTRVWVKVGTEWKKAIPWVKVDGTWKKVKKTYVKVNGTWKRTVV